MQSDLRLLGVCPIDGNAETRSGQRTEEGASRALLRSVAWISDDMQCRLQPTVHPSLDNSGGWPLFPDHWPCRLHVYHVQSLSTLSIICR